MEHLHVVGHTADRRGLIVACEGDGSQFVLPVDDELLDEVEALTGRSADSGPNGDGEHEAVDAAAPSPGGLTGSDAVSARAGGGGNGGATSAREEPSSRLPPREIQARLRAGESVRSVAQAAGISTERVERWLRAVEGEREQVLAAWRVARLSRARLGPSHDLLGDALRINLRAKGVDPDSVKWKVRRTDGQGHWTVELRYTSRGRTQRARYRYYPEWAQVEARNELAEKLGWTRGSTGVTSSTASPGLAGAAPAGAADSSGTTRSGGKTATTGSARKKAAGTRTGKKAAKKAAGKKAATKSTAKRTAKKGTAKKAAKKGAAKKATKKGAAKKAAKTGTASRATAKKAARTTPRSR